MESTLEPQQTGTTRPPQHEQPSKRRLKLQRWESHRDEIYDIYVVQNQTLQATMRMLKEKHDFVPSMRKFKEKIKEWQFEKYLSVEESRFINAKVKTREDEGKGTTFYKNGIKICQKRIKKCFKRKRDDFEEFGAFAAGTPQQITYHTPLPEQNDDSIVPYKFSEGKQRDQDQMRVSLEPFAHPSAIALINLASVTDGSELHRYADSSGTIKETVAVSNEVVEVSDDKAENEIIELQSFTAPLRLSREPAAREVAPRAQSQAKREGSCVALEMDYGPLYNCEECADNILGAELNLPEASASWTTKRSEPVENNDLEVDRGPPALSPIINENIHVPTTYNEASGRATEKQAIPEQMHNISVVDAELSRFVERIRMYGARFIVHFGSLLEPATVPSINELRDVVSSRETTDGILGLETLKAVQKLAKALEENFELEEAESLYRRAIVGFRELRLHRRSNESQQILDTQIRLGRLFCSQQRYKEAQYLLLSATPRLSPDLDHLKISVYGVLLDVYIQLDPVAKLDVVPWMQKLLERPLGITTTGLSNFLIEGIHVARVYYIDGCHKSAHSILKRVVAKLELLDDNGYGIDKLEGYLEYSCICQRMDIWDEASKYFQLAQGLLKRASGCEANAVQFVESRLSEISLRSRGAYESPWGESSSLYMASRRYDDYHGGSDGTLREDPLTEEALRKLRKCKDYERPRKGGSSKTDTGTSANGSLRYGVTYPGSESTGGAISEFLYP